jgi:glycosyltransferase involved in cell wall biosynthesis
MKRYEEKEETAVSRGLVVIPAFNEEKRIASVISDIKKHYPEGDILVVDDGSKDGTRARAAGSGVRVISHPFNLGYGASLQTGYRFALISGYEELIQMDGDGQHDPGCIRGLLSVIRKGEADIVIGSRFLGGANSAVVQVRYRAPLGRRLGMKVFGAISSVVLRQRITDPTSGFQAMNRDVMAWVSGEKFPFDYPDADVIIMLHRAGFRIREVPVQMFENSERRSMHSGLKPVYYVFKMFLSIFVTLMRK